MRWTIFNINGEIHLAVPGTRETVCLDKSPVAGTEIDNIAAHVTCPDCLIFARTLHIPTAK
jgi:hypothetical protein